MQFLVFIDSLLSIYNSGFFNPFKFNTQYFTLENVLCKKTLPLKRNITFN